MASEYTLTRVEPAELSDEELLPIARRWQLVQSEMVPEDPAHPVEAVVQRMRTRLPSQWRAGFVARGADGDVLGYAVVGRSLEQPGNAHLRWCSVSVHAADRRRGIGGALLRQLVEACEGQGEDLVFTGSTNTRIPASEAFARAIGATAALPMKINQLDLRDVDRLKVAEWAARPPSGYRLEKLDGEVPERSVKAYLQATSAMNDSPRGDLRMGDWRATEEQLRERVSFFRKVGLEWWAILATHESTGEGAGFTDVTYDPRAPHVISQLGTGVVAPHRGHGIGLWMKATMLSRILAERPKACYVRTGNADMNKWMLDINTKLGFREAWAETMWQLPLAEARRAVKIEAKGTRT